MTRNAGSVTTSGPTRTSVTESRTTLNLFLSLNEDKSEVLTITIYSNTAVKDTSLFDESNCRLQVLSHTKIHHDAGQPPPAGITQT